MRILLGLLLAASISAPALAACPPLLNHTLPSLTDQATPLCQFEGKVLLVVNTASQCGYTPQYEGLEALYRRYREKGLVVLGFPANAFYATLAAKTGERPQWNFHKYLIDRSGEKVLSFGSGVAPEDRRLLGEIERMLAAPAP